MERAENWGCFEGTIAKVSGKKELGYKESNEWQGNALYTEQGNGKTEKGIC